MEILQKKEPHFFNNYWRLCTRPAETRSQPKVTVTAKGGALMQRNMGLQEQGLVKSSWLDYADKLVNV